MCFTTEHVNTVSQSERVPSSIWVFVDVRHAFCHFLSCCQRRDECIEMDLNVSKLCNTFIKLLLSSLSYVRAYTEKKRQEVVHKYIKSFREVPNFLEPLPLRCKLLRLSDV